MTLGKIPIFIPQYQRQQVDELIKKKVITTVSEAVRRGLDLLIRQERAQLWNDEIFTEYESSILKKDRESGVLMSRQFQQDLNCLVKKEPELRRRVSLTLRRLVNYFDSKKQVAVFPDKSLEIKQLELKDYYFADFEKWRILLKSQGKNLIACKIGYTTQLL